MHPLRYDAARIDAHRNTLCNTAQRLRTLCDALESTYHRLEAACPREAYLAALRADIRKAQDALERIARLERLLLDVEGAFEAANREVDARLQALLHPGKAVAAFAAAGMPAPASLMPASPFPGLSSVLLTPAWLEEALERELGYM